MPLALAMLPASGPADDSRQPGTASLALSDRQAGVPPVMEVSASRLSANETTGRMPVGQDRQDARAPAKLTVMADPLAAASGPDSLAANAAARDAALAQSADDFFHRAADVLQHSPLPDAEALPGLSPRNSVAAATAPTLDLPIHAGRTSLGWITRAIRDGGQLPPPNAVRLEEILNSFTLRPAGCAAICRGVSITTESLPCPWKPSATLLLISIHGAADAAREVTATFHADPATVAYYRLLGFAPVIGLNPGPIPAHLPAKSLTTLALEIEPSAAATAFGSLEWTLDGQAAATIPVTRHLATEPSDDARFASLVCAFAQWLAHDHPVLIDAELLAALARETASATLPQDRADLLTLIGEALDL